MKFDCLVWYSKLHLSPEDNNFISNFLEQGCKIISDEIKEKSNGRYNINIDYLNVNKGEEGLKQLFSKLDSYNGVLFTNGHSIAKYNKNIINQISGKKVLYFSQNLSANSEVGKNVFKVNRVDKNAKLAFIFNEIKNYKNSKIYFLHTEARLSSSIIEKNKSSKNFTDFSFKGLEDEKINNKVKDIFSSLENNDLIILDIGLKYFREVFNYLEEKNIKNKVIITFGSIENRFKKISFELIQLVGNIYTPSLSIQDLISRVYKGDEIGPNKTTLLLDSTFRLEVPILAHQALTKLSKEDIETADIEKIRSVILGFDGKKDIFLGKKLQYGFNNNGQNILTQNYAYIFPNSVQLKDYELPKILNPIQYKTVNNKVEKLNVIYPYIDVLRVTNVNIQSKFWTAEFYLDIVSQFENPIDEILFNNLSTLNEKFNYKEIWTRKDQNNYNTKRYYVVANFDFLPIADNYPFDWQNLYIALTIKDNSKLILQPIPQELIDHDFDVNEWNIESAFSGIKYNKNKLYQDTDLKKTVSISSENRVGWILKRKNTATLLKIGIPMFFLVFLVYYSVFLDYENASQSVGILTTTFLSAIALYFSAEKPEPKKMTIIDLIFVWFYVVNGITVVSCGLTSFFSENIFYNTSMILKGFIPISLVGIIIYLYKRIQRNREDILLDRDI